MDYKVEKKDSVAYGQQVDVLAGTFEGGQPEGEELGRWRQKLGSRAERLKYLETGERYWFSNDWYGSERRKTPA